VLFLNNFQHFPSKNNTKIKKNSIKFLSNRIIANSSIRNMRCFNIAMKFVGYRVMGDLMDFILKNKLSRYYPLINPFYKAFSKE
jgi:hypothetical protein